MFQSQFKMYVFIMFVYIVVKCVHVINQNVCLIFPFCVFFYHLCGVFCTPSFLHTTSSSYSSHHLFLNQGSETVTCG
jgi:hypothetical protein